MTTNTGQTVQVQWASLIERIHEGDASAGHELWATLADAARARLHWGVDPQVVEDELQDVVVSLLEAIRDGAIHEPEHVMGFVRTLTRRRVSLHIRTNIRRRSHLVPIGLMDFATPAEQSPEAATSRRESRDAMETILQSLLARDREILMRFYFEEQDLERICQEMGLTSTQFRLYKSRALGRCHLLAGSAKRPNRSIPAERRIA